MSGRCVGTPRGAALTELAAVAIAPLVPARQVVERMDHAVLQAVVARRPDAVRIPAVRLTELAEPAVIVPLCVVAAARALSRRTPPPEVLGQLGWAAAGIGIRRGLAETVRRGRPPPAWWWHFPSGFSYPSRHVTWAVLGLGTAADLCGGGPGYRRAAAALTAAVVATRVLLAVHWPSDVVAALVYSAAWRQLSTSTPPRRPGVRTAADRLLRAPHVVDVGALPATAAAVQPADVADDRRRERGSRQIG